MDTCADESPREERNPRNSIDERVASIVERATQRQEEDTVDFLTRLHREKTERERADRERIATLETTLHRAQLSMIAMCKRIAALEALVNQPSSAIILPDRLKN